MTKEKLVIYAALGVLAVGAIKLMQTRATPEHENKNAKGVTKTRPAGSVQTTPIQPSRVAWIEKPLNAAVSFVRNFIPSSVSQQQGDQLQAYRSPEAAEAAYTAPIRPDYAADIKVGPTLVYSK